MPRSPQSPPSPRSPRSSPLIHRDRWTRRPVAWFLPALLAMTFACIVHAMPDLAAGASAPLTTVASLHAQRILAAFVAGVALATAGVFAQSVASNALADPAILGTSGGAFLGAKIGLALGALGTMSLASRAGASVVGALVGALLALAILLAATRRANALEFLLTGFLLSAVFSGASTLLTALAQEYPHLGRALVMLGLGDLSGAGLPELRIATPLAMGCFVAAMLRHEDLDLLALGADEAQALGMSVQAARTSMVGWIACGTTASVILGGQLAFVGLLAPHLARKLVGGTHRRLVPVAALAGGLIVVASDRVAVALAHLVSVPAGAITTLAGAPFFFLILRGRRAGARGEALRG